MKKNRKAQVRMSETVAVLFIFFILVVFGIVFYYKYTQVSFKEEQIELLGSKARDIALSTLFLPELICSDGEAEPEDFCFDLMKLRTARDVFSDNFVEYYFNLFPYSRITVKQLYPEIEEDNGVGCQTIKDTENNYDGCEWVLYEKIKPTWENKESTFFVVTLRDEISSGDYSFGVLTVEVYS